MLEVGLGGMTDEEVSNVNRGCLIETILTPIQYKAHFSMWAALKSPLLLGNDLRKMSPETLSIINNPAIIALSQDPRGKAIQRVTTNTNVSKDEFGIGEAHVWSGPLAVAVRAVDDATGWVLVPEAFQRSRARSG